MTVFDLVQELRKNKRRPTKHEEVNPFSGICYCADCGKKLYLCRATTITADREHLKCGTYAKDKNGCTIHFIRTIVLKEIILGELNKMVAFVKDNENEFVQAAMDNSVQKQSSELAKSRKKLRATVAELTAYIDTAEQKSADVTAFIKAVTLLLLLLLLFSTSMNRMRILSTSTVRLVSLPFIRVMI